ncbi:dTDP-glucose 4,6-dehydratase [Methylophilaceae bacterium]|nr:dTDP-glucose 4,6-dehydratase [Methylophilaceae bacterium]
MTILVTGAAGFIGANFVLNWLNKNDENIINLDKLTYAGNLENLKLIEKNPNYHFLQGDIADSKLLAFILSKHKPRAILHFAAESHVDRSFHDPSCFIQTNILGTYNLLEAARSYYNKLTHESKNAFRFLHVSTDEVYGSLNPADLAFKETNKYYPNSPYSASKASSDHLVHAWFHTYGLPVLITNCSNNFGPYQFPEKLIPLCILKALQGHDLPIYGDGQQVRDWLYVDDHCSGITKVLEMGAIGETYNIGGWNEKTNLEVVHTLCDLLDELSPRSDSRSYKDQITFIKDRPGHDRRYAVDASKIFNKLKWKPEETFETGIRKTVSWFINNLEWVAHVQSGDYQNWLSKNYS